MQPVISADGLTLGYNGEIVIKNAAFTIAQRDFVFISGQSGSGKSTLLRALYGDLAPMAGSLCVLDYELFGARKKTIESLRRDLGVIFQDYKLIKDLNIEKNIMLPMQIAGFTKDVCISRTERLLSHVKLSHKAAKFPLQLSGGEQQRAGLARALAHGPSLVLADEPTGNLDDYSSEMIWNLLRGINLQNDITFVVVTHRIPEAFGIRYRHFHLEEGTLYELS